MRAISRALADESPHTEVFLCDEADVDLNPRIGRAWIVNRAGISGDSQSMRGWDHRLRVSGNPGAVHIRKSSNPGLQRTSFGNLT